MEEDFKLTDLQERMEKLCNGYDVQTVLDVLAGCLFDILKSKCVSIVIVDGKEEVLPHTHKQHVEWEDGTLTIELK